MTESEKNARVRGWLLQLLRREPVEPDGRYTLVRPEALQRSLFACGYELTGDAVREHLAYLRGKQLVEFETFTGLAAKIAGGPKSAVRITSQGVDVVERTRVEAGIDLGLFD